jgi:hypothetical protein
MSDTTPPASPAAPDTVDPDHGTEPDGTPWKTPPAKPSGHVT